jgi:hypothetical protein
MSSYLNTYIRAIHWRSSWVIITQGCTRGGSLHQSTWPQMQRFSIFTAKYNLHDSFLTSAFPSLTQKYKPTGIIWFVSKDTKNPKIVLCYTAIPYRASTGPEQGFPCVVFPHREKPVFITGNAVNENRFFPVRQTTQGKPCFHYRDGFAVCI